MALVKKAKHILIKEKITDITLWSFFDLGQYLPSILSTFEELKFDKFKNDTPEFLEGLT